MKLPVALSALLVLVPMTAAAEELDRRIAVAPGGRLQVDLDFGEETRWERVSLEVRSHEADEVWAVADLSGLGSSTVTFRIEHEDSVVRLYGRARGVLSWLLGGPGVQVRVWVPREFSVDLRCTSGPIRVEEIHGTIRARTTDAAIEVHGAEGELNLRSDTGAISVVEVEGDVTVRTTQAPIELSWVTGSVEARAGSGDIRARHIDGRLALRTDSGEIGIRDLRGSAEAKTERGAIYASFAGAPAGILETRRGSVEVVFPGHFGTRLDATARRGSVEVDPGLALDGKQEAEHAAGSLNGGGAPLHIYTAHGSVHVARR
jgi:hypothetical protein